MAKKRVLLEELHLRVSNTHFDDLKGETQIDDIESILISKIRELKEKKSLQDLATKYILRGLATDMGLIKNEVMVDNSKNVENQKENIDYNLISKIIEDKLNKNFEGLIDGVGNILGIMVEENCKFVDSKTNEIKELLENEVDKTDSSYISEKLKRLKEKSALINNEKNKELNEIENNIQKNKDLLNF